MKILVIHGPNLNMLGKRDPNKYGTVTMEQINHELESISKKLHIELEFFQSNHEGSIIDFLQKESSRVADGLITNPGALIRYAYSFRQALVDFNKPFIELHMSDISKTGVNKKINILDDVPNRIKQITGMKEQSYYVALQELITYLQSN